MTVLDRHVSGKRPQLSDTEGSEKTPAFALSQGLDPVREDPTRIGPVAIDQALARRQGIDLAVDVRKVAPFAHQVQDQCSVLLEGRAHQIERGIGTDHRAVADVGTGSVEYGCAVEDEWHSFFQASIRRKELVGEAKSGKGGPIPEPGERDMEPVAHPPVA